MLDCFGGKSNRPIQQEFAQLLRAGAQDFIRHVLLPGSIDHGGLPVSGNRRNGLNGVHRRLATLHACQGFLHSKELV